jgi:hypothetical protein
LAWLQRDCAATVREPGGGHGHLACLTPLLGQVFGWAPIAPLLLAGR